MMTVGKKKRQVPPYGLRSFYRRERRSALGFARPRLVLGGFHSSRHWEYPQAPMQIKGYVADLRYEYRVTSLNPQQIRALLKDKFAFENFMLDRGFKGSIVSTLGAFNSAEGFTSSSSYRTLKELFKAEHCFMKPRSSTGGGEDASIVTSEADLEINAAPGVTYLLQRVVKQAQYAREIFPDALNTMRVQCLTNAAAEILIVGAAHRFGTRKSAPTDSWSRGSLLAPIDTSSGVLGSARPKFSRPPLPLFDRHPETGVSIQGRAVPGFREVTQLCIDAMSCMPDANMVGFDVVVGEDGPCIVEANGYHPNIVMLQVGGPVIRDTRIRSAFRYHRLVGPMCGVARL